MHRAVSLILITILLLSAGCLSEDSPKAGDENIQLITPPEGFSIFGGQGHYSGIIGQETPDIPANYSMGCVTLPPGNATPLHRLLGTTECVYILQGTAEIFCDNVTVTAREGETIILPEGVLQSISSVGEADLAYIDAIQPPFTPGVEISGDDLLLLSMATDSVPIVISDPSEGIEWDMGSDMMIYTLANPVLMPEKKLPVSYSVAFAELLPDGSIGFNKLQGSSEVIYVITGEVEVFTPEGSIIRIPAGSAGYIPPDRVKGYRNAGESPSTILSFVDPAWTLERTTIIDGAALPE